MTKFDQVTDISDKFLTNPCEAQHTPSLSNPGYKQTEAGRIPDEWSVRIIGELCRITTGNKNTQDKNMNGSYPFFVRSETIESIDSYSFDGEGVLTAGDGVGTGKIFHYINGKFDFHQRVYLMYGFVPELSGFYFYKYFSNRFYSRIMSMTAKSSVDSVRREMIYDMPIPLPGIREQIAIANALSDFDALTESLEKLVAKKQAIKTATMQQLLTGKTRLPEFAKHPDGTPKGTKQSELGEIPEDWNACQLGKLSNIQRGASPRPIDSPVWFDQSSSIGWLRISDLGRASKYLENTIQNLSQLGVSNSRFVASGNLVMSICATVGKPIITHKDLCIHDGFVVFNGLDSDIEFMYYVLKALENEWSKFGQTGSQMNLNTDLIKGTQIRLPSQLAEQQAIAVLLSDMDSEIRSLQGHLEKSRQIKQGMMQQLLTGKTRLIQPEAVTA
ncbi:restriction endonuclease subunit S [Microbulbifer sp. JMSA003]|uniref:restriction endonuclease subunit S n=1 Tax=Microbulbifer sp. JMSA003 TaxID=3243369 RepID=UPI00403A022A